MSFRGLVRAVVSLMLIAVPALATSTIDPTQPLTSMPYSSAPIRNNFQAAYNDINALQNCNRGSVAPSSPNSGYCWFDTSGSPTWVYRLYDGVTGTWIAIGSLNSTTGVWTPAGNIPGAAPAVVLNTSALRNMATTTAPLGVIRATDGTANAPPLFFNPGTAACTLNGGNGDVGSQVPSADGKCWLASYGGSMDLREWSADPTDTNDATGPITAALAYCGTIAGTITPGNGAYKVASGNLVIPKGCTWDSGIWIGNQNGVGTPTVFSTQPAVWLGPSFTIQVGNNASFKNTAVYQLGLTAPTSLRTALQGIASFAGTAITQTGNNADIEDVLVIGFAQAFSNNGFQRTYINHLFLDSTSGLSLNNVQDVAMINNVEAWEYYTGNQSWSAISNAISAIADNGSGAIRVTIPSTSSFLTGDTVQIGGIASGDTGARGRWVATVVDGTHLDLQGSQFAPTTTCTWGGQIVIGSQAMTCTSINSLWPGMTVTATGISGGTTITAIDRSTNTLYLNRAASSGETGETVTFGQGGSYTGDGVLYQSTIYRTGTFLNVTNSAEVKLTNLFAFGWDTSYHVGGNSFLTHCVDCSDDHYAPAGDPVPVSLLIDGTAGFTSFTGGSFVAAGTEVVMNTTNGETQTISGTTFSNAGLGMAMSLDQGRIVLSADTMIDQFISIPDSISNVSLAGDDFAQSKLLFNTVGTLALSRTQIDGATVLATGEGSVYQKSCNGLGLAFGGASTGITYAASNNGCFYRNIGGYVIMTFDMLLTSKGAATGVATLTGLPFAAQVVSAGSGVIGALAATMSGLTGAITVQPQLNTTSAALFEPGSTGGVALSDANFTNTSHIFGTITYPVQ